MAQFKNKQVRTISFGLVCLHVSKIDEFYNFILFHSIVDSVPRTAFFNAVKKSNDHVAFVYHITVAFKHTFRSVLIGNNDKSVGAPK